jgi:uncharacterized caspase-like protein
MSTLMRWIDRFKHGKTRLLALALLLIGAGSATAQTQPPRPPVLWIVTVGVSDYPHAESRKGVKYAAKDARDVAQVFRSQEGKLFAKVHHLVLTDREATKEAIAKAMTELSKRPVRGNDYVIVAVAGHGHEDGFAAYDQLVSWSIFRDALGGLPGTKLLIVDTCRSAAAANAQSRQAGVIVLASCLRHQGAQESRTLENGFLTGSVVAGLRGEADLNNDGTVTLAELYNFVDTRLRAALGQQQHATVDHPALVPLGQPLAVTRVQATSPPSQQQPILVEHTKAPPPK